MRFIVEKIDLIESFVFIFDFIESCEYVNTFEFLMKFSIYCFSLTSLIGAFFETKGCSNDTGLSMYCVFSTSVFPKRYALFSIICVTFIRVLWCTSSLETRGWISRAMSCDIQFFVFAVINEGMPCFPIFFGIIHRLAFHSMDFYFAFVLHSFSRVHIL